MLMRVPSIRKPTSAPLIPGIQTAKHYENTKFTRNIGNLYIDKQDQR